MVLTAAKGIAMVVMDRENYIDKAEELLVQPAYRKLDKDPTNKIKARLVTKLRTIIKDIRLDEGTYKIMYPPVVFPPKFYGLLKIHKTGTPLRPIVSNRGLVTYGVAKCISKVLKPLVGKSLHHVQSTVKSLHHVQSISDFVKNAKKITLQPGECLMSYDVTALFTSIPIDPALKIIKVILEKDETWQDRAVLSVQNIIDLLGFCQQNTYFSFQNEFYEHVEEVVMGSPVCPIFANLYKEHFERKALQSASNPPRFWFRFVDET